MRKWAMRGLLTSALFVATVTMARAADDEDDAPAPPPPPSGFTVWWSGLFGGKPKPIEKVEKKAAPSARPSVPTVAERDTLLRREKEDYFRRLAVCDKLRGIAMQQNNVTFEERITELEKTIFEVYQQRTASLGQGAVNDDPSSDTTKPSGAPKRHWNRNRTEDDQ
jgi:hypothetical protein